jgi:hypothetical protein
MPFLIAARNRVNDEQDQLQDKIDRLQVEQERL